MVVKRKKPGAITASCLVATLLLCCAAALTAQQERAIEISGDLQKPVNLSAADLSGMPRITVRVGSSTYSGVLLADILKRVGVPTGSNLRGKALTTYVLVEAEDGYQVLFSLGELDPGVTEQQVVVADSSEGKPLPETEGSFRIVIPQDKIGARSVRMLKQIRVIQLTK